MEMSGGLWYYLTAGNVARSEEFMAVLRAHTYTRSENESEAIQCFRVAPRMMKARLIEEYLNTKWGITAEQFRDIGATHFPADVYSRIHAEIEQMGIGCEIVIAGFAGGVPVLCLVNQNGEVTPHTGFITAGSGYMLAQASLFQRNYRWTFDLERAMYCVYEAKKLAERAVGVGPTTNMAVYGPLELMDRGSFHHASINFVSQEGFAELERQFATFGPQSLDSLPKMQPTKMFDWPHLGEQQG